MRFIIADHAGFCFGVKRAIQMAEDAAVQGAVTSLGPLIHNNQETQRLQDRGIIKGDLEGLDQGDIVLIRSHGVGPQIYSILREKSCVTIDATCPYVQKAQKLAAEATDSGYQVIILGEEGHAEVQGIVAWTEGRAKVVKSWHQLSDENLSDRVAVLAQTTEKEERFSELVEFLQKHVKEVKVLNTICSATRMRQRATAELAQRVDIMVIIGGKHSSNTRKLWEVCKSYNKPCYHIEESGELRLEWFYDSDTIGITAGASTPDWIIKEVMYKMEEMKDQIMEEETKESGAGEQNIAPEAANLDEKDLSGEEFGFSTFQSGDMVKGKVVKVSSDEVMVDIGAKSEGIVSANEISHRRVDPMEMFSLGDEILVEVIKEDNEGNILLSRKKALQDEALLKLEEAFEKKSIIEAPVVEVVKGGLLVDVGMRGFVPASQIERSFVEDISQYLNQNLRMKVLELDKENKKAVLSQRAVLDEENQKEKEVIWQKIQEGQVLKGTVSRLASFGAFIDLGGIDGLLHISEMSWGRIENPSEVVKEGEEIEVFVLKVDREKERISLGLKQLMKSPWDKALENYKPGMIIKGSVVRLAPFGAFVELEPGVEGLVHISQVSTKRVTKIEEVLNQGQEVDAKIIDIDPERKRISLSLKDVVLDKEKAEYRAYLNKQDGDSFATIGDIIRQNMGE